MRILNRKQFLALKGEVVFAKYTPCHTEDLGIKVQSFDNDFIYQDLDPVCVIEETFKDCDYAIGNTGTDQHYLAYHDDMPADLDCCSRDGCFDDDQLFMVLSRVDVEAYVKRLQQALSRMED